MVFRAQIDLRSLSEYPDVGLAIAWIVAGHDLQTSIYLQDLIAADTSGRSRGALAAGAYFYVARLYAAQASEATRLVKPIESSLSMQELINSSDEARAAFGRLLMLEDDQTNPARQLLHQIRNKGTFHYFDWRPKERRIPGWLTDALRK